MSDDENLPGTSHRNAVKEACAICLNNFTDQEIGKPETCDHKFCLECIIEWSAVTNTCPIDRIQFSSICIKHNLNGRILKKIPVKAKRNENDELLDEDRTFCEICGQANREDRLLLCDGCDRGFHLECLTPPLQDIPVDEWFCINCAPRYKQRADRNARARNRRIIPRTRAIERVRNRIADMFGDQSESGSSENSSDEEDEEESSNSIQSADEENLEISSIGFNEGDYLFSSDDDNDDVVYSLVDQDSASASSPRKRRTTSRSTGRRKTYKKRRRRTKSSSKKTPKKSKTRGRRKSRRRRKSRKGRKRGSLRRIHSDGEVDDQLSENAKIRGRLASTLNIVVPSKKEVATALVPKIREPYKEPTVLPGPKLSLLGNNYDLLDFDDDSSSDDDDGLPHLSKNARKFDRPIRRHNNRPQETNGQPKKQSESVQNDDLLSTIMADQNLLHTPSSSIVIHSDGSLEAKAALNSDKVVKAPALSIEKHRLSENQPVTESTPSDQGSQRSDSKRETPRRRSRWSDDKKDIAVSDNVVPDKSVARHVEHTGYRTTKNDEGSFVKPHRDSPEDFHARTQIRNGPQSLDSNFMRRKQPLLAEPRNFSSTTSRNVRMDDKKYIVNSQPVLLPTMSRTDSTRSKVLNAEAKPRADLVPPPNPIFQSSQLADVLPFTLGSNLSAAERFLVAGNQQQAAVDALLLAHAQQQQLERFLQPMAFANNPFTVAVTQQQQQLALQQVLAQQQVSQTGLVAPNFIVNNLAAAANVNSMLDLATFAALQQPPPPPPPPFPPAATSLAGNFPTFGGQMITKVYAESCLPSVADATNTTFAASTDQPVRRDQLISPSMTMAPTTIAPVPPPSEINPTLSKPQPIGSSSHNDKTSTTTSKKSRKLSSSSHAHSSDLKSPKKKRKEDTNISSCSKNINDLNDDSLTPVADENPFFPTSPPSPVNSLDIPIQPMDCEQHKKQIKTSKTVQFHPEVADKVSYKDSKFKKVDQKKRRNDEKLQKLLDKATTGTENLPENVTRQRDKALAKFNYQLRVEEEVKLALKPFYSKRRINKEEYKDIMRKTVPKICKKRCEINPAKIREFVENYVSKVITRH